MKGRIEHVNLTVSNAERSAGLLSALCGWHRRWQGPAMNGGHAIHLGDADDYIAFYTPKEGASGPFPPSRPFNHVGLVVDDLDRADAIVTGAGLTSYSHDDYNPGRRFYFRDWDDIEWEVVSYA